MKLRSRIVLALAACALARFGSADPLVAAVMATGSAGDWGTVLELANPTDQELSGRYFGGSFACIDPSGLLCRTALYQIPAHQTLEIDFDGPLVAGFEVLEISVGPADPPVLPTVRAFARNRVTGSVNEILVSTVDAIRHRADPKTLSFPGIPVVPGSHVNVGLTSIADVPQPWGPRTVDFQAKLELFDPSGTKLGETTVSGCGSALCRDVFVGDVAAAMGLAGASVPSATLRVTQLDGGDSLWGQAVVVNPQGFVTTVAGFNP